MEEMGEVESVCWWEQVTTVCKGQSL